MVAAPVQDSALEVVTNDHLRPVPGPRLGLPTMAELEQIKTYSELVVASGMAPKHIDKWETAAVIMRYGHQLGVDEFTSLQNMYVINGKPAMMASLMHAMIMRDHGDDAVVVVESTPERCELRCKRRLSHQSSLVTYTMAEAQAAGLPTKNAVWKSYPADMLFARAISRAGRQVFRDTTMGLYVPEEIGGNVIEVHGEIVEVPVQTQTDRVQANTQTASPAPSLSADEKQAVKAQFDEIKRLATTLGMSDAALRDLVGKPSNKMTQEDIDRTLLNLRERVDFVQGAEESAESTELDGMPADNSRYDS